MVLVPEPLKGASLLEVCPPLDDIVVGPWLEVYVELIFVRGWVEAAEDSVDEGPHVFGLFKGAGKDPLGFIGKVEVRRVDEESV